MDIMKKTNWTEKELTQFCEDNFLDNYIAEKLTEFMKGEEGTLEVIPKKGDEQSIANLKIDVVLSSV